MANVDNNGNSFERATAVNSAQIDENNQRRTIVNQHGPTSHFERSTSVNGGAENVASRPTTLNQEETSLGRATIPNQVTREVGRNTIPNQDRTYEGRETTPNQALPQHENPVPDSSSRDEVVTPTSLTGLKIEGFTVSEMINNKSGEALLYKCIDHKGKEFAIKYFQRTLSEEDIERHSELVSKLRDIKDGVVQIKATGVHEGHLYEIMPYYEAGSLKDRMKKKLFTEEEIKKDILPRLLSTLKSIHEQGIYHADIKPENIMYKTKGRKDLVLIDFGVSKITQGRGTTFVTIVGGTADYQAPEMFRGILLPETDYYALGITLFELLVGRTPTAYIQDLKDVERATLLEVIPQPDGMSDDMYRLIYYLTFDSIRNRHNRKNHNNRWVFEEVNQWLIDGNPWYDESEDDVDELPDINIRFGGKLHDSMSELLFAMAGDWERGCDFITRPGGGLVAELAKSASRNRRLMPLSIEVKDFVDAASRSGQSADMILFEFIYQYGKNIKPIFWKGNTYRTLDDLGKAVFRSLSGSSFGTNPFYELLSERLLDIYAKQNKELNPVDIEKMHNLNAISYEKKSIYSMYLAAYALMDEKRFFFENGESVITPSGLKLYLAKEGSKGNLRGLIKLCKEFIYESGDEKEGFQAWYDVNKKLKIQQSDPQDEIKSLSPIEDQGKDTKGSGLVAPIGKVNNRFSFLGLILGLLLLSVTIVPFVMLIKTMVSGRINLIDKNYRYAFLFGAVGLPVVPLLLAKIFCIPRNNVTNTCFKIVSTACRILKFDAVITIISLVYEQYSNNDVVNSVINVIHNSYSWVLQNIRMLVGYAGSDEILNSLAKKMSISQEWFNDVVRLIAVFIIYTIAIAILKKHKER